MPSEGREQRSQLGETVTGYDGRQGVVIAENREGSYVVAPLNESRRLTCCGYPDGSGHRDDCDWSDQGREQATSHAEADRIIDYALTICMYGERAPGGDENWHTFGVMAENYLRRRDCEKRGHTPSEPSCPDCATAREQTPRNTTGAGA